MGTLFKKGKKPGNLSTQFNLLIAVMTTIIVTVMIIQSGISTSNNVANELRDQAVTGTSLLEYELSLHEIQDLEDKTATLDRLKNITGFEFTIFNNDIREFSTITIDGERVIGTTLDPEIADIVINKGETYLGEAEILGEKHITSYIPYKDEDGKTIGVLFSGINSHANDAMTTNSLTIAMFVGIALILIVCIITKRMIDKAVAKPLDKVMDAAQKMSTGDMNFELNVDSNTEIGSLADTFNTMKFNLSTLNGVLVTMLGKIADGDWNVDIGDPDIYVGDWKELYNSVGRMTKSVRTALTQVSSSAQQISSNVTLVSSGAQTLATGSIDQASSVEALSTNLHEISEQVQDNSKNARKVNDIAIVSGEVTKATLEDMQKMIDAMNEISNTSENIEKVIKIINDIAFQTNILALNAAVEAARAGTAGKGFAVVADEVRNLAQKSSEAVRDTAQMIEHSMKAVQTGQGIAMKANASFEDLASKVQQMVATINEIATATEIQSERISEIASGIEEISTVVQHNTATSEESAAASVELSNQADTLHGLVNQFKLK